VHDWPAIVGARLAVLGLDAAREEEIRAELAGHLEDEYAAALQRGRSEQEAVACALARVPDWVDLARTIHRADKKDGPMSPDTKTLWLPGMAALCCAGAAILMTTRLPPSLWANPRASLPMAALSIGWYVAVGALGSSWSRRAGGNTRARFAAGLFPLVLHLAIIVPAIIVSILNEGRTNFQRGELFASVLVPGVALAIGTLPFLRSRA
jgi:hypothetical protein